MNEQIYDNCARFFSPHLQEPRWVSVEDPLHCLCLLRLSGYINGRKDDRCHKESFCIVGINNLFAQQGEKYRRTGFCCCEFLLYSIFVQKIEKSNPSVQWFDPDRFKESIELSGINWRSNGSIDCQRYFCSRKENNSNNNNILFRSVIYKKNRCCLYLLIYH